MDKGINEMIRAKGERQGKGFLPALKLGQLKVRRSTLMNFIESCEGKDFSDLDHVKDLEFEKITEEEKCC